LADRIAPIRLGSRSCFEDRWQGRVSSLEVDESWDVLNIGISSGFLFTSVSVRLPFTAVTKWSDDAVTIASSSFKAFAREIPPVAAPARPLDASTPISSPGMKFAGLVVRPSDRRVAEVLLSKGVGVIYRVPVKDISFSGKTLAVAIESTQLVRYHPDADIHEHVHRSIAEDAALTPDDKRSIDAEVEDGIVTLRGNVRVKATREYLIGLASNAPGAVEVRDEVKDDFEIEAAAGQALDAAGAQREAQVYVRSNLGDVTLYGSAPSLRHAEDITRVVVRLPGVRNVSNRMRIASGTAAGAR